MESNSIRQLSSYRSLIISRWPQVKEDSQHNVESSPVVDLRNRDSKHMAEQSSRSLTTLMDFDTNAAIILLEQEFKEVVSLIDSILRNFFSFLHKI